MAMSTCPKCGGHMWEIKQVEPARSRFKLYFVQCSMCGTPVGVHEYDNVGAMLGRQNDAIKKIAEAVNVYVDLD